MAGLGMRIRLTAVSVWMRLRVSTAYCGLYERYGGSVLADRTDIWNDVPLITNKVDDVSYITGAIKRLSDIYGISPDRVYGIGRSNGGIMTQRLMCEAGLYAASISVAGPLMLDVASCPAAKQKRILDIHGAKDENVPIAGGKGTKGVSGVTFTSEASTEAIYKKSGAQFTLLTLSNTDHKMDNIRDALKSSQKADLSEVMAKFFGLIPAPKRARRSSKER